MVIQTQITTTGQMGTGGSDVRGHPGLHRRFGLLKNENKNKNKWEKRNENVYIHIFVSLYVCIHTVLQ